MYCTFTHLCILGNSKIFSCYVKDLFNLFTGKSIINRAHSFWPCSVLPFYAWDKTRYEILGMFFLGLGKSANPGKTKNKDGSCLIAAFQLSPAQTVCWSHCRPNYSPDILAGINICKWAAGLHYHMLLLAQRKSYSLSDVQTDASHTVAGGLDVSLSGLLKYSRPADKEELWKSL